MFKYLLYQLIHVLALVLPKRLSYLIATVIARVGWCVARRSREAIIANLEKVVGTQEAQRLGKSSFVGFGKFMVDFFRFDYLNERNISSLVRIENWHYLEEAFSYGQGVIGLTAHLGHWELGGVALALNGVPVEAVALAHPEEQVNRLFTRQRERCGVRVIPVGVAVRRCFKALREGKMVAVVGDRDPLSSGVVVPFFGKPARIPKGPAVMAVKTGAAILPGFTIRMPGNRFVLFLDIPFLPADLGDEELNVYATAVMCAAVIEKYIRLYPSQWFMYHRVWED